jgi:hypothetical protein
VRHTVRSAHGGGYDWTAPGAAYPRQPWPWNSTSTSESPGSPPCGTARS